MTGKIEYDAQGNARTFTGEGVNVFMAAALRSGLGLLAVGIKPHRTWTSLRAALEAASSYTGQKYSGKKDIERARADLAEWIAAKKAELS